MQDIKIDIGCGKNKKEGFLGVDQYEMEGVDVVLNVGDEVWPWEDGSVSEIHASHFIEHLTPKQRIHVVNEAYRVLKEGGKMTIITPHWASNRAYGDLTHQWPPVAEMWFFYLSKEWRDSQAPHTDKQWNPEGYSCNFTATWAYSYSPALQTRGQDHVQYAIENYKEAIQDMHATCVKPLPTPQD